MVNGTVNVDLYSAIITTVSNALNTLVSGEKPGFEALSKGLSPAVFIVKLVNLLFSVCFAAGYIHSGETKIS